MNPFDFVNSINSTKEDLMVDEVTEKGYNSYMVNKALSYFIDTVMYANDMNERYHLDNKMQYFYLINTIRSKKRFSKWIKNVENNDLTAVQDYYGYSLEKAKVALSLLSNEQLTIIKKTLETGGTK
jgi:hypothetical protein